MLFMSQETRQETRSRHEEKFHQQPTYSIDKKTLSINNFVLLYIIINIYTSKTKNLN
jgi:hypothetical protein